MSYEVEGGGNYHNAKLGLEPPIYTKGITKCRVDTRATDALGETDNGHQTAVVPRSAG